MVLVATGKTQADGPPAVLRLVTQRLELAAALVAVAYWERCSGGGRGRQENFFMVPLFLRKHELYSILFFLEI